MIKVTLKPNKKIDVGLQKPSMEETKSHIEPNEGDDTTKNVSQWPGGFERWHGTKADVLKSPTNYLKFNVIYERAYGWAHSWYETIPRMIEFFIAGPYDEKWERLVTKNVYDEFINYLIKNDYMNQSKEQHMKNADKSFFKLYTERKVYFHLLHTQFYTLLPTGCNIQFLDSSPLI